MIRLPHCHTRDVHHQLPTLLTLTNPLANDVDDSGVDEQDAGVREESDD